MDENRLDSNAAAGVLGEVFSFEVTAAEYACAGCGRTGRLGGAMVYEVREMGAIVRCPECDNALIRLSQVRERSLLDLTGTTYLTTG